MQTALLCTSGCNALDYGAARWYWGRVGGSVPGALPAGQDMQRDALRLHESSCYPRQSVPGFKEDLRQGLKTSIKSRGVQKQGSNERLGHRIKFPCPGPVFLGRGGHLAHCLNAWQRP